MAVEICVVLYSLLVPIYEYIAEGEGCAVCRKGFELRRPVDREPLTRCPMCKKPVRKVISAVNTPKVAKPLSVSDAKSAGFKVYQKRDKGVYEKL